MVPTQGRSQLIGIRGLSGDLFNVNHDNTGNIIAGLGLYRQGASASTVNLYYGFNAYYLLHTSVRGKIATERVYTNLSYRYSIVNTPFYASAKAVFNTSRSMRFAVDLGVGGNIIQANKFSERSLDGGMTTPDHIFTTHTSVSWSGMAGLGVQLNDIFDLAPFEINYRFFYLGQGKLNKASTRVTNTLVTGNSYASALMLTMFI